MKKFFRLSTLWLALLAILFFACKHDGNNNTPSSDDPKPVLKEIKIHGVRVEDGKVTVSHDKATVKTKDVKATFNISDVAVSVKNEPISLEAGKETIITIEVPAVKGKYKAIPDIVVKVTRKNATPPPEDPALSLKSLKIHKVDVTDKTTWKVSIPNDKTSILQGDVEAIFDYGTNTNKTIPVTVTNGNDLEVGVEKDVTLTVSAASGQYKGWTQVIKVMRKLSTIVEPITIKGTYVDDKLVIYPDKEFPINKDSCTVKITVPKQYAKVEIDEETVSYVAGTNPTDLGSYSKEIQGITKGSTKSLTITITDASHNNSPFSKTLKIKHEDTSIYTPVEIERIGVGDESYKPATDVNGKNVALTGELLNLSVFFKKNVEAEKEKLRFTLDGGEGDKTQEKAVTGKRVNCDFVSVVQGEHDVKIERLVQNEVKDTFTFKVTLSPKLEKITVASLKIENENANVVTFKKLPVGGARALSELELADEANIYKYIFSEGEKISVTVDVITEDVKLEYRVGGQGSWTEMTNNTKQDISVLDGLKLVEIKITKAGFKETLYKFKAWKKSIVMKSITIDTQSYTWAEFEALTTPVEVTKDKITIVATWENDEVITPRLIKNGKQITVVNENKTSTWKDVVLEAGENSFRVTFEIVGSGIKWKKKDFKVKKASSPDSNVNVSDMKIFSFRREALSPKRIEWPFARTGMTEFDIYVKPESNEVKGIKLKSPFEVSLSKITEPGYEEYYKASQNIITSGDKIIFEVEAKDGSKKEYFVNKQEKWQVASAKISFEPFIRRDYIYYGEEDVSNKSPKKLFDKDSFLAEVPVSENKIYLMFELLNYSGVEAPSFTEGITLVKVNKEQRFDTYVISYDTSSMQVGEVKDIEIHLKFKSPTNQIIDLFQYAKYTIKLSRN